MSHLLDKPAILTYILAEFYSLNRFFMKTMALLVAALALIAANPAFCQVINDFTTYAEDQQAVLEWRSGNEAGVVNYEIQRSFDSNNFHTVAYISPAGSGESYRYVDRDLFKNPVNIYYYRIKVNFSNGESIYSDVNRLTMISSGIYRTWGSIKAMFR